MTREEEDAAWEIEFGAEAQKMIRDAVDASMVDYEYLRSFRLAREME